jgi:aspartyl-tRNA(Asn)/glutamyl-tRNA(Gln) amidotransferase subunit C
MILSQQDVERVALLARLRFSQAELDVMTRQLGQIVNFVEQLGEPDTANVEPMAHAIDLSGVFRQDEPRPSLPREQALANAPHADGECFLVPAVLG